MIEAVHRDIRYALRLLSRSPLFTLTAVASLVIGVGANAAIFAVASALLLRPLPGISAPNRVVDIGRTQGGRGFDTVSWPYYRAVRERATALEGIYALRIEPTPMSLGGPDGAERIYGTFATGNYFDVLGTKPRLGRLLSDADDVIGREPVVVLSFELWQRRFSSDPAVVRQSVTLNGHLFSVIGVAPKGFHGTTLLRSDIWMPISTIAITSPGGIDARLFSQWRSTWLVLGGRLRPGVDVRQADAELSAIGGALEREQPLANEGKGLKVLPSAQVPGRIDIVAGFLALLMAIVGIVLVIACVNLAGMLLARAAVRRREIAVRLALGASRVGLVRQMLTETAVLFALGGAAGLLVARWLVQGLLALLPALPVPIDVDIAIDWRVAMFTAALSLTSAVLSSLGPALQASGGNVSLALKGDPIDGVGGRLRLRSAFVVGQITLSLVLVIVAALFCRALDRAARIDPGFDQTHVDAIMLDLSLAGYQDDDGRRFAADLVGRTAGLPGVRAATLVTDLPLDGNRMGFGGLKVPGRRPPRGDSFEADWNAVAPGFFQTLEVSLVRGRDFTKADGPVAPRVAIVNQALARTFFGEDDPIGRQMLMEGAGGSDVPLTIVGVAADARLIALGEPVEPYVYVPLAQQYDSRVSLVVRTSGTSAIPGVRSLLRQMNPNLPVSEAMPLSDVTAIELVPQRIAASVAGSLGLVGVLLVAIGIYGVTSYSVSRRTKEIGIRMSLGADRCAVVALVLRQAVVLTSIGVAIGIALAAAGSQLLGSLLFGVEPMDPIGFAAATSLLVVIVVVAAYVPARGATRVDPLVALRTE